jgi:hypothetical protein
LEKVGFFLIVLDGRPGAIFQYAHYGVLHKKEKYTL